MYFNTESCSQRTSTRLDFISVFCLVYAKYSIISNCTLLKQQLRYYRTPLLHILSEWLLLFYPEGTHPDSHSQHSLWRSQVGFLTWASAVLESIAVKRSRRLLPAHAERVGAQLFKTQPPGHQHCEHSRTHPSEPSSVDQQTGSNHSSRERFIRSENMESVIICVWASHGWNETDGTPRPNQT